MTRNRSGGAALLLLLTALSVVEGCKATPPGKWETAAITTAKHWVLVRDRNQKNPLSPTPENIANGKESFAYYCVVCHGLDGQNTGVPFAGSMSPPVPSLASPSVQSYTDGQLKWVIENGIFPSGMPASKNILTDEEMWSAVLYIRHLPAAGSQGEPSIFSDDDKNKSGQAVAGRR
jgi:mono/diheme cytochrome c family protein